MYDIIILIQENKTVEEIMALAKTLNLHYFNYAAEPDVIESGFDNKIKYWYDCGVDDPEYLEPFIGKYFLATREDIIRHYDSELYDLKDKIDVLMQGRAKSIYLVNKMTLYISCGFNYFSPATYICDECKAEYKATEAILRYKYCPSCGAAIRTFNGKERVKTNIPFPPAERKKEKQ